MNKTCSTCQHWRAWKPGARAADDHIGECHAETPLADFKWPKSKYNDHCGKHAASVSFAQAPAPATAHLTADLTLEAMPAPRKPKAVATKAAR